MTAETHIRPDSLSNGTGFYRNASNELCCEDTLLSDIAHRWGTPTYVYSVSYTHLTLPTTSRV